MNKLKLLTILSFAISQTEDGYSQWNNPDSLLNKFKSDIQTEQKVNAGAFVMDDETRQSYLLLMSNAKVKDLIRFTNDTNAVVRSYVFASLVKRKADSSVLLKILEQHKNDTIVFVSHSTDVVMSWTVREYMKTAFSTRATNKSGDVDYLKEIERLRNKTAVKIKIHGAHHGLIEKNDLLKIDSLFFTDKTYRVLSFSLSTTDGQELKSTNQFLTNDMKAQLKKMIPGDIFSFDNIKVCIQDGQFRYFIPLTLKIK